MRGHHSLSSPPPPKILQRRKIHERKSARFSRQGYVVFRSPRTTTSDTSFFLISRIIFISSRLHFLRPPRFASLEPREPQDSGRTRGLTSLGFGLCCSCCSCRLLCCRRSRCSCRDYNSGSRRNLDRPGRRTLQTRPTYYLPTLIGYKISL